MNNICKATYNYGILWDFATVLSQRYANEWCEFLINQSQYSLHDSSHSKEKNSNQIEFYSVK